MGLLVIPTLLSFLSFFLGALKGCWNFPHPFNKLRTMPDLSLRSGRPSPKAGEGKFSPILGEMPEGQRGRRKINQQLFSAPFFLDGSPPPRIM